MVGILVGIFGTVPFGGNSVLTIWWELIARVSMCDIPTSLHTYARNEFPPNPTYLCAQLLSLMLSIMTNINDKYYRKKSHLRDKINVGISLTHTHTHTQTQRQTILFFSLPENIKTYLSRPKKVPFLFAVQGPEGTWTLKKKHSFFPATQLYPLSMLVVFLVIVLLSCCWHCLC